MNAKDYRIERDKALQSAEYWRKQAVARRHDNDKLRAEAMQLRKQKGDLQQQVYYERNNPYYNNLVQECEDLRKINADNNGPVWTKRLHEVMRDGTYNTFHAFQSENARLNRELTFHASCLDNYKDENLTLENRLDQAQARAERYATMYFENVSGWWES